MQDFGAGGISFRLRTAPPMRGNSSVPPQERWDERRAFVVHASACPAGSRKPFRRAGIPRYQVCAFGVSGVFFRLRTAAGAAKRTSHRGSGGTRGGGVRSARFSVPSPEVAHFSGGPDIMQDCGAGGISLRLRTAPPMRGNSSVPPRERWDERRAFVVHASACPCCTGCTNMHIARHACLS